MQLTQQTQGNNVIINRTYDSNTGRLTDIDAAHTGTTIADYHYDYDNLGNVTSRADNIQSFSESFGYDELNRLTSYVVNPSTTYTTINVTYTAGGSPVTRTDIGTWHYGQGSAGPQEVTNCVGCTIAGASNPMFDYNGNGSMTKMKITGGTAIWTLNWNAFNMVSSITAGTGNIAFAYDSEHHKVRQQQTVSGTLQDSTVFLDDPNSGVHMEVMTAGSTVTWRHFLNAYGEAVGVRSYTGSTATYRYFITDNLGSTAILTDASGSVVERLSYDAWGRRRCATPGSTYGNGYSCEGPSASQTDRGYAGHDMLDLTGMIDMKARPYSPVMGRFLSADTIVPDIFDSQSLIATRTVGTIHYLRSIWTGTQTTRMVARRRQQSLGLITIGLHPLRRPLPVPVEGTATGLCATGIYGTHLHMGLSIGLTLRPPSLTTATP